MFQLECSPSRCVETLKACPWWDIEARFLVSVESGDLNATRHLLSLDYNGRTIDPDIRIYNGHAGSRLGKPAICSAIERGLFEMTKLLIDHGASVNIGDVFTPVHYAVKNLHLNILRLLVANRADVNALSLFDDSPLHLAAQLSSIEILEELIKAGADLEKVNCRGQTALAIACMHNQVKVVETLLRAGSSVNHEDKDGDTPLLHAIKSGLCLNSQIVGLLLNAGADPDHINSFGQTALTTAVRRCSESNLEGQITVKQLIDHNCHINNREAGPLGETAIHLAISRGQDRIVEMLIRAACDVNCINQYGESPLERLAKGGKTDPVKLIIAAGAKVQLAEGFWNYFNRYQNDQELGLLLISCAKSCPSLKHLCRIKLRQTFGRKSDYVFHIIDLPEYIKEYLMLNQL